MKKIFLVLLNIFLILFELKSTSNPVILLQTFGNTEKTGRSIANNTERGITIKLAESIYDALIEEDETNAQVFITNPGKTLAHNRYLDSIDKINQIQNAIVIQLSASKTTQEKPICSIFYRCYNPLTDQIARPYAPLTPIPFEDTYLLKFNESKTIAKNLILNLKGTDSIFDLSPLAGIPLAHIRGIRHPVVQVEISTIKEPAYEQLATALAQGIKKTFLVS